MLVIQRKACGVALVLIGYELGARPNLDEFISQDQPAVDRASLQDTLIGIAREAGEAVTLRYIEPHVNASRVTLSYAVGENDRRVEKHVRIANIDKVTPPVRGVQLEQ